MTGKVAELGELINPDNLAKSIIHLYDKWRRHRKPWLEENLELRDFIFATDTTKTTNRNLPWKTLRTSGRVISIDEDGDFSIHSFSSKYQ